MELSQLAMGLCGASSHFRQQAGRVCLVHGLCSSSQDAFAVESKLGVQLCWEAALPESQPDAVPQAWGGGGMQRTAGSTASLCGKGALLGPASHQQITDVCWRARALGQSAGPDAGGTTPL